MTKRLLSVLLAVLMIVTMIPVSAFADETETTTPTVVNGEYVDGVWQEGGDGTKVYTVKDANGNDSTLELSKTATPVEGMPNCYDITLKVETSTNTVTLTNAGAVVLVIDVSNSMKWCAECGGENGHASGIGTGSKPQCTHYNRDDNRIKTEQTRMTAAINAAINFLNSYAGSDTSAVRMVSVVTFGTNYTTVSDWKNIAGKANDYEAVVDAIDRMATPIKGGWITNNGGTNLEAGLVAADKLLSNDAIKNIESKNVVLLTDGKPTYRLTNNGNATDDGSGSGTSEAEYNEAKSAASSVKTNPTASLYTVCFGASTDIVRGNETVGEYLKNEIATSGCAYNADNTAALNSVFTAISEKITNGIDGAGTIVTDPMADKISVQSAPAAFTAEDGTNYQWKLSNAQKSTDGNVTTYVYELTYTIKLNVYPEDFKEGQLYPTNGRTYLNLDENTKLEFPVPGVTGSIPRTDFEIKKIWDDNDNISGFRTNDVTFILKGGVKDETFTLTGDITNNEWVYTVKDVRVHDYEGNEIDYYVVEQLPDGSVYTPDSVDDLVITNTYVPETTDVTVTKVWDDNNNNDGFRPENLTVKLLANGTDTGKTVTLNENNQWTDTFAELLKYSEGKEIDYTVEEVIEDSWKDKYTAAAPVKVEGGYSITNSHVDEVIDLEITKIWADNKNNDGKRPTSIQVEIYKNVNGTETFLKTVEVTGTEDTWTFTAKSLPKYEAGTEILYTVKEVAFDVVGNQYVASYKDNVITNTLEPNTVDIPVTKIWEDNSNEEGFRPDEITVNLLNGEKVVETVALSGKGDEWTGTFKDLPKYKDGNEIAYTVEEVEVDNYTTEITGSVANGFVITNSREVEKIEVTVTKVWVDDNNRDGIRPTSITVKLLANDTQVVATKELTDGNLTFTFDNLNVYKDGEAIEYTVEEVAVNGYESAITGTAANGYTITNTHAIETTTVSGTKTWVDDGDRDGIRPESITVNLLANGEEINDAEVTAENGWKYEFKDLPVNENGEPIKYEVTEDAVADYEATVNGFDITNKHDVELKDITVTKTWSDDNNRDGVRPETITVTLLGNGEVVETATFGENEDGEWTYTFEGLYVNANGEEIVYTIEEADITGYSKSLDQENYTITNTHEIELIEVKVEKVWDDEADRDGIRPESLGIVLYADDEVTKETLTLNEDNSWKDSFENLPKYRDGGVEIVYTVEEVELPDGYQLVSNVGNTAYDYVITNKHDVYKVSVHVIKDWQDSENIEGFRPDEITVTLKADGTAVENGTVTLNAENNWEYMFTGLNKNDKGTAIEYTVEEAQETYYAAPEYAIVKDEDGNFTITIENARDVEYRDITVTKIWDDSDNVEGFRPESITVELYDDGVETGKTLTLNEANSWKASFTGLQKYRDGVEIEYTVKEVREESWKDRYTTAITGSMTDGFTVTNTRGVAKTSVPVTKVWEDESDRDGARPETITVKLLANGTEAREETFTGDGEQWTYTFTGLNVYANGEEIEYTVEEVLPEDTEYTVTYGEDNLITNTYEPKKTAVTVEKIWEDDENRDGIRPETVVAVLYANGEALAEAELSEEKQWTYTFENLYVYENKAEIVYSVEEFEVAEGYEAEVSEIAEGVITITNTHEIELTEITVEKLWEDDDNNDGIRPESVTVTLLGNGEAVAEAELSEENQWTYTFEELPVYTEGEVGKAVEYTFEEAEVEGYESEFSDIVEGKVTLTNTHENELTNIIVEKVWSDDDNNDGLRATEIAVQLYANGQKYGEYVVLSEENAWTYTFENLEVFAEGELVEYTVLEADVEGYEASYSEITDGKITITNTHESELVDLVITKLWEDQDNEEKVRPESVEVELYANGELLETVTLTAEGEWKYELSALKYAEGIEVEYTIKEVNVPADYEAEYDQETLTVTNTLIKKVPQTGDYTNMNLYIVLAAVSFVGFGVTLLLKKKEEN